MTAVQRTRKDLYKILTERDGFQCYLCPLPFDDESDWATIDHVTALANGGTWDLVNLKLAHRTCNQEKADRKWLDDGTLEPKNGRRNVAVVKANKRRILDEFCDLCFDGRLLLPDENCTSCERQAVSFPWSTKRRPKDCSHGGTDWCWCCSIGIYERKPAWITVVDAENFE